MQLRTNDFQFNGKKLSELEIQGGKFVVVNTSESNKTRKIGLTRSLTTGEGVVGNKTITGIDESTLTMTIIISKFNSENEPATITDNDLEVLTTWLFSPVNYKELVALDEEANIIYYGMFTDGEQTYLNKLNQGYITLTFELDSNHAYGREVQYTKEVNGTLEINITKRGGSTFTIDFKNNVGEYYYPDIEFNVSGSSFSIENTTLGERIEFNNLDASCRKGVIYGEGIMTIISSTDATVNMREKSNRKFLRLKNGVNTIKIIGSGTFTFHIQPKISLR